VQETLVQGIAARGHRAGRGLLEVPAELVDHLGSERGSAAGSTTLLWSLTHLGEVGWQHDRERPRAQRTERRRVGFDEERNSPSIIDKLDGKNTKCEPDRMTQAAKKLLDEFDALADRDRSELVAELVRRVALAPHDLPHDDDLISAADHLFIELDRHEQSE
jgi:hypothetical protein